MLNHGVSKGLNNKAIVSDQIYYMPKKSCHNIYSKLLCKPGQDFLDRQYIVDLHCTVCKKQSESLKSLFSACFGSLTSLKKDLDHF